MVGRKERGLRKGRRGSSVSGIGLEGRKEGKVVDLCVFYFLCLFLSPSVLSLFLSLRSKRC